MLDHRPTDGRTLRAMRTCDAIVEACARLVTAGHVRPSTARIAEEAAVSLRTIGNHFEGFDALLARVGDRTLEALQPDPIRLGAHPDRRSRMRFGAQRAGLLEAILPFARAATLRAPFSGDVAGRLELADWMLRDHTELAWSSFADTLDPPAGADLLDLIDATTSRRTWEYQRGELDRDPATAKRIMMSTLDTTIRAFGDRVKCQARS